MPAQVVAVHDDAEFLQRLLAALRDAGLSVAGFTNSTAALDILDDPQRAEALVTRIDFAPGKPDGIALARMLRLRRPGTRILFIAKPEFKALAQGLGELIEEPAGEREILDHLKRLLRAPGKA
jgi:DNA-binding NtrC family response regulator